MSLEELLELNEAFDTHYSVVEKDVVPEFNTTRYYFYVDENKYIKYRIFVERSEDNKDIEVGFERLYGDNWIRFGETNDLSTKQVLGLFGTVAEILKKEKFESLYISSNEAKKFKIYSKMISRLVSSLNANYYESGVYMVLTRKQSIKNLIFKPVFKYGKSVK